MLVQIVDERAGIFGSQVATVMGNDSSVLQCDDIAADGKVVGLHVIADGGSFERAAPFVDRIQVVAQDGRVGHLAARRKAFGYGDQSARAAILGQQVHHGFIGILQQRLSA